MLANRLKPFLPSCISHNQWAFVPKRSGVDNVVIAQDAVAKMKKMRNGKHGFNMINLDLEKVYDKINWEFLLKALKAFNFLSKWVNLFRS